MIDPFLVDVVAIDDDSGLTYLHSSIKDGIILFETGGMESIPPCPQVADKNRRPCFPGGLKGEQKLHSLMNDTLHLIQHQHKLRLRSYEKVLCIRLI